MTNLNVCQQTVDPRGSQQVWMMIRLASARGREPTPQKADFSRSDGGRVSKKEKIRKRIRLIEHPRPIELFLQSVRQADRHRTATPLTDAVRTPVSRTSLSYAYAEAVLIPALNMAGQAVPDAAKVSDELPAVAYRLEKEVG